MTQLVHWAALSITAVGTCTSTPSVAADEVAVTPYRPTVSTPAALSATNWIEVEFGLLNSSGGAPPPRDSAPYVIKLAFSDNWGVRIGGELWVRDIGAKGRNIDGIGDTAFVLKRRFAVNEQSAFGLELGVMSPTAPAGLHGGSGGTDYGVNAIYSTDFAAAFHTDINYSGPDRRVVGHPAERRRSNATIAAGGYLQPVQADYLGLRLRPRHDYRHALVVGTRGLHFPRIPALNHRFQARQEGRVSAVPGLLS